MYIFFDTETNGLPKNYQTSCSDHDNWPRILQIAWSIYDEDERAVRDESYLISVPDDVLINESAQKINGLTKDVLTKYGMPIDVVIERFTHSLQTVGLCIAH